MKDKRCECFSNASECPENDCEGCPARLESEEEIRAKAITEFAEAMINKTKDYKFADFLESSWSHAWAILHFKNIVNEIAEQLKGGK